LWVFTLLLLLSCSQVKQVSKHKDLPNAIPVLRITNDTSASAIKVSALDVDIKIAANIAITTFDIIFYNPNDRILEGELEFPLADGQSIVRYALDINNKLREGVIVGKAKGRIAFENTIRRKVDPGLVEKTKGNNFRTRIYPLPAKGTRHIVIAVEQTLESSNKDLIYQLPLKDSEVIQKFSIDASVIKSVIKPVSTGTDLSGFDFIKKEADWAAEFSQNNFTPNNNVTIIIPGSNENTNTVLVENTNETSYYYVNSAIEPDHKKKALPKTIGILWDISASGEKRELNKEKQFLKQWISQLNNVKVSLIPFNITVQNIQQFDLPGDSDAIIKQIESYIYDGGTQLGSIDCNKYPFDELIIFTDGLSTFGKKEITLSTIPVTAISSSASADFSYLKYIAQQTHGTFIDLNKTEVKDAIEEMISESFQVIKAEFNPSEIDDLVLQNGPIQNSGLAFTGKLKTSSATIKLQLGFGNNITTTKTFTIKKPAKSDYNNVKRIWAEMKIANLDLQFEKNKEEITKIGKQFSIVTQNTSLIVLDRVEDYVQNEITPPEELQKEYFTLLKEKQDGEKEGKATALSEALDAMSTLKEWWQRNYSPNKKIKDSLILDTNYITSVGSRNFSIRNAAPQADMQAIVPSDSSRHDFAATIVVPDEEAKEEVQELRELNITAGVGALSSDRDSIEYKFEDEKNKDILEKPGSIELNDWKPDVVYLKEIEKVVASERKAKYYSLRKEYSNQPSFFIDIARFFIAKNEKQFGLLVLSNVAEMKLEDAELLRMMANQLLESNEKDLAIETFRDVVKMREEHPQSYRDLALALNESGNYSEAVDLLYKVIMGTWDSRFVGIKSIAINELNAIISANKGSVNTSSIDKRFIYPMPVDVRIVIEWNTDNSDIDLWVTDPRKEKCYYEHTETEIGGKISQDVTGGFGPEEFSLKNARQGNYMIEANLFGDSRQTLGGPITIKAELFTDFGKPAQKRETINFRVTTNKEVVKIGSLKFGH